MLFNLKCLWSPYCALPFSSHRSSLRLIWKKVEVEGIFLHEPPLISALAGKQDVNFLIDPGSTTQVSFASTPLSLERQFQNLVSTDAWKLSSIFQAKCVWDQLILMFFFNSFSPSLTFYVIFFREANDISPVYLFSLIEPTTIF